MIALITQPAPGIGGKAANLLTLQAAGLPVPALRVCPASATAEAFANADALAREFERVQGLPSDAQQGAASALYEKAQASLRADWLADLQTQVFAQLGTQTISVRSSATAEDSTSTSFAGQYHSVLNVTPDNFADAVRACLTAQFAPSLLAYAATQKQKLAAFSLSLIFQTMIPAELAGVLFTQNPTGPLNEQVITIGRGTGDNVVTGDAPVTTVHLGANATQYWIQQPDAPKLSDELQTAILVLGEQVSETLNLPACDLEFAWAKNTLWVLQARPITTIPDGPRTVLSNANLVESYPGLTLPLSLDFARANYSGIFTALAKRIVGRSQKVTAYAPLFAGMTQTVNGRLYYELNNWYALLQLLPGHRWIIPIWERMLGMPDVRVARPQVKLGLTRLTTGPRLLRTFFRTPKLMDQLNELFSTIQADFTRGFEQAKSIAELLALYDHLMTTVLPVWDITLMNDLYAFVYTGLAQRRHASPETISGIANLESMRPVRALETLAAHIQAAGAREKIQGLDTRQTMTAFLASGDPLAQEMQDYLDAFGDRTAGELKLETHTLRVAPERLVAALEPFFNKAAVDTATASARAGFFLKRAQLGIRNRETSRLNRSRLYGMARQIMRRIGELLVANDQLASIDDVFYLQLNELRQSGATDWRETVVARKQRYADYAKLPDPGLLIFAGPIHDAAIPTAGSTQTGGHFPLVGTPSAGGHVTAPVIVVDDPSTVGDVRGKILVTATTDPGWVFLLSQAAGIIAEHGSLLSHTAIIARELNIPTIVGVPHATTLLRDGMRVTLDADRGQILEAQHD